MLYSSVMMIYLITYLTKTNYSIIFGDMVRASIHGRSITVNCYLNKVCPTIGIAFSLSGYLFDHSLMFADMDIQSPFASMEHSTVPPKERLEHPAHSSYQEVISQKLIEQLIRTGVLHNSHMIFDTLRLSIHISSVCPLKTRCSSGHLVILSLVCVCLNLSNKYSLCRFS